MSTDFTPEKKDYKILPPFKMQVLTNFPYIEADFDALTNYQLLCKIVEYLNMVIHNENELTEEVAGLYNAYVSLQNYVNNYFDNLDVQEEINNKLDEMAESGQLTDIIAQYLGLAGMIAFDTVADMKLAENLVNGSKCCTLGYYSINDGGMSTYKIREVTNQDVIDESTIIALNDINLVAELIIENNTINIKQFGGKGDDIQDDTNSFINAFNFIQNNSNKIKELYLLGGTYKITSNLTLPHEINIIGQNTSNTFIKIYDFEGEFFMKNINWLSDNILDTINIKNVTFIDNSDEVVSLNTTLGFSSTINSSLTNVNFITTKNNRTSATDLYSNNKNFKIDNILVDYSNANNVLRSCIGVREFSLASTGKYTSDIFISNCSIKKDGKDEFLWIDAWKGKLKNIFVSNCNFIDTSNDSNNGVWIGTNGDNSSLENVIISNCNFYKENISDRFFSIGLSQASRTNSSIENIKVDNCNIITNDVTSEGHGQIFKFGEYIANSGVEISNCIIKSNSAIKLANLFNSTDKLANIKVYNCDIKGKATTLFNNINYVNNCIIDNNETGNIFRNVKNIINNRIINAGNVISLNQNNLTKYNILNNIIENCNTLIDSSSDTVQTTFNIFNNDINNSGVLFSIWSPGNGNPIINFKDNNINQVPFSNNANPILNICNVTINGVLYGQIPAQQNDRACMPVGTRFISNTQGKSIVRKISIGNTAENWEEL